MDVVWETHYEVHLFPLNPITVSLFSRRSSRSYTSSLPLPRCYHSRPIDTSHWSLRSRDVLSMRENAKLKSWPCASVGTTFHHSSPYVIEATHIVLPTLRNIIKFLLPNLLVVVTFSSFPALATPITPRDFLRSPRPRVPSPPIWITKPSSASSSFLGSSSLSR
ncbi:hypothetical protein EDB89DRAFT_321692 [Lactarius sanguifluus]|nr:hypothetical protein EDB89DRAFT_321692 [Lactarius sanguifluus]